MYTRSPARKLFTPSPTASTSPAASEPGVYGSGGLMAYCPLRMYVSTGFTPTARIRTSTWPLAGRGSGTSASRNTSAPPNSRTTIAFITLSLAHSPTRRPCRNPALHHNRSLSFSCSPRPLILARASFRAQRGICCSRYLQISGVLETGNWELETIRKTETELRNARVPLRAQVTGKPVTGQTRHLFQRPRFLEQMGRAGNDLQPFFRWDHGKRLAVHVHHRDIVAAHDEQRRHLHPR